MSRREVRAIIARRAACGSGRTSSRITETDVLTRLISIALLAAAALAAGCSSIPGVGDNGPVAVTAAAERLRVAMVDPTRDALNVLVADELSYGHSGGKVDTKQSFIDDLISGASDFVNITISEQTVKVVGDTALIRHRLVAATNDGGKPGNVDLKILQVWQRQGGQWKLLARQAVRTPA